MNKNLTKLITSAAVALAMGSSVNAQSSQNKACPPAPFEQGYGISNDKFPAAYNAPARVDVQQSWDIFFTGSYTYWYVDEAGFDLARNVTTTTDESVLFQNNSYSSGFKVGVGVDFGFDSWVGFAEYTWLRNSSSTGTNTVVTSADFVKSNLFGPGLSSVTVAGNRSINMDMVDATLSRPFYEGRKMTLLPYSGLRAAWIRQKFTGTVATATQNTHSNSNSWAVGPRAGVAAHWMLGWGFRFEGDMGASVLYQSYKASVQQVAVALNSGNQNHLAPVADMCVGLGWGSYLDRQNYHLDFVATYDFMNWWGQNFIRQTADQLHNLSTQGTSGADAGSLQISGLTITARFDF